MEPAATPLATLGQAYLDALLAPDARGGWSAVRAALDDGVPARAIYLEVLAPAMVRIGELWESTTISVAQEHLATQITQSVIARLAPELGDPVRRLARRAVVAATPGDLHEIGQRMVGDFLEAEGWEVLVLGADVPPDALARLVAEREIDVVALSTALPANLLAAGRVCGMLRRIEPPPLIVVGGRAYGGEERRALAVGADVFAPDPVALLRVLDARFGPG